MRFIPSILGIRKPIHLTLFVTRRCNSACPFCFYRAGNNDADASNELTLDEIKKLSSSLGSLLWLALSGGEVFLRKDPLRKAVPRCFDFLVLNEWILSSFEGPGFPMLKFVVLTTLPQSPEPVLTRWGANE